jgi:serine/threonine protein kinase
MKTLYCRLDALAKLRHPNIVKYHGSWFSHANYRIIMDYCAGGSLEHLANSLGAGRFSEMHVAYVAKAMVAVLQYVHEHKFVHRDIKCGMELQSAHSDAHCFRARFVTHARAQISRVA